MKTIAIPSLLALLLCVGCKGDKKRSEETVDTEVPLEIKAEPTLEITPVEHASAVLQWGGLTIYMDPVGDLARFSGQQPPDLILITDIHWDHFSLETLKALETQNATVVVPQAVADEIPADSGLKVEVMANGESRELQGVGIEAVPMYNLREEALEFHEKGRGNGYVLTLGGERIYFSGDTEDIPEMRALEDIDKAFVCMNLPYTMTVERAADAVIEFKPLEVYPYHYRGSPEVSDVKRFKELVNTGDPNIKVVQLDWYPNDDF